MGDQPDETTPTAGDGVAKQSIDASAPTEETEVTLTYEEVFPAALFPLLSVDCVFINQNVEFVEICCGCETNNQYQAKNILGKDMYSIIEDTNCCCRNFCGKFRSFNIFLQDFYGHAIILKRRLAWNTCWCPCWLNKMKVYTETERYIGQVVQEWNLCKPRFVILNAKGDAILRIKGPCCTCQCCKNVEFKIWSNDGKIEMGTISKNWSGFVQEVISDADNFSVRFPMDMDPEAKALLLGSAILIDYMYYERSGNKPAN